jgi:hypothetical protein
MMIHEHVPFVDTIKPSLTTEEQEALETVSGKLRLARRTITPSLPRSTPGWLQLLHDGRAEVIFTRAETITIEKVSGACLAELRNDGDLSAHVAGVGLAALRSAHEKLAELVHKIDSH